MKSKKAHKFLSGAIAVFSVLAIASTVGCGDNGSSDEQSSEESKAVKATEEINEESSEVETVEETEPETEPETEESEEETETSLKISDYYVTKSKDDDDILLIEFEFYNGESEAMSMSDRYDVVFLQNDTECRQYIYEDVIPEDNEYLDVNPDESTKVYFGVEITDMSDISIEITDWSDETVYLLETLSLS